ncbi:growth-regulating factor 4-like [Aristolochia californica]|uniref:growth-regulating factor 4-like n=1 Tax=Aristolochia californica TaxID=171875 RepID=UPI0035DC6D7B
MTTDKGRGGGRGGGEDDVTVVPPKLARTEAFPFRMLPLPFCTENGLGPTYCNGSSGGKLGGCDLYSYDGAAAATEAAAATMSLQPFPTNAAVRSPGMTASFRFPFTSAQWQELERQALIYKCMIASVPIPSELLIPKNGPDAISSQSHLTRAASFNLRFSNNADPEPGRCRRTDGKKWRCSRDVAPDQKYCERHMHRGRPRSRKPVEVQSQSNNARSIPSANASLTSVEANSTFPNLPTGTAAATSQLPSGLFASELSYQNPVPASDREPRYLDWMRGRGDHVSADQPWQLTEAKGGLRSSNTGRGNDPGLQQQYEDNLNLNFSDFGSTAAESQQNDQCCLYLNSDLSAFEDPNQRDPPRPFIVAWSMSARDAATTAAATNNSKMCLSPGGELPMSSLTLSMPNGREEDFNDIQMSLSVTDSEGREGGARPSWSSSLPWVASPLGGPLGEVLQSSTTAGSNSTSSHGDCSSSKSSCGGLNLMSEGWAEGSSPLESPLRVSSSPTGVLQKTLPSLSDSSGSSSPTFAAATKPQMALQWLNNQTKLPS